MTSRLNMIAATDVGCVRPENEDSLRVVPDLGLVVVADGMGGHKAGEIASRMAVGTLCTYFEEQFLIADQRDAIDQRQLMSEAITTANTEVFTNSRKLSHMEGMGTTLVAARFNQGQAHIGHIGDSRCYRFRTGQLTQLTDDHTLASELLQESPDAQVPTYAHHVLKKALGIESHCEPDVFSVDYASRDIFLICSDGLNGVVDDSDISTILTLRAHEPELCVDTLIRACLVAGAPDNVSVVLVIAE